MKLTLLGSCRQDSLSKYFQISGIRDNLTYPHYSKEVVQAVEFCKGVSTIPYDLTQHTFRSGILRKQPITPDYFKEEYEKTDLFVVEIASRLSYIYKDRYVHHILSEPQYGFHDIGNIKIEDLSDLEIEEDLVKLKELLYPKPFFIVTHIYTRTYGKRFELIELLKKLCSKHNIPIFDPVEHTKEYDSNLMYEKEAVLSHYTKYGHEVIGKKYYDFIKEITKE